MQIMRASFGKGLRVAVLLATTALSGARAQTPFTRALLTNSSLNSNTIQPSWATVPLGLPAILTDAGFLNPHGFGATLTGCSATPTDDSVAWSAMVAQTNADWTNSHQTDELFIPAGCLYLNTPVTQFGAGVPVHIHGAGSYATKIVLGTGFTGDVIGVAGNFTPGAIAIANSTLGSISTYDEGPRVTGLMIDGNTGASASQNGIMFYDSNEFAVVRDVEEHYLTGCGLCMGLSKNTAAGLTRESQFEDIRILNSGGGTISNHGGIGVTTAPEIGVYSSCTTCTTGSSANALTFSNIRLYAYNFAGFFVCPMNTNAQMHNFHLYGFQVEGRADSSSTSDGIRIGDPNCTGVAPFDIVATASSSNVPSTGKAAVHLTGPSSYGTYATAPYDIDLIGFQSTRGGSSANSGIVLDYGEDIYISTSHCNVTTCLNVGAGTTGAITVDAGGEVNAWTIVNNGGANLNLRGSASYLFTPTAAFASGGSVTVTGTGIMRNIGGEQFINESFSLTVSTLGTGQLVFSLPALTINSAVVTCPAGNVSITGSATALPGAAVSLMAKLQPNANGIVLSGQKAAGSVDLTGANMTAGETLTADFTCTIL